MEDQVLSSQFQVGEWVAEPELHQLRRAASTRHLEPKVMELLVYLARRPGRTVTRQELLDTVWQGRFVAEGVLNRCVSALRHALEDDPQAPHYIRTVPKRGYRLVAAVAPLAGVGADPKAAGSPAPGAFSSAKAGGPPAWRAASAATTDVAAARTAAAAPPPPSIAVLPFKDLNLRSHDPALRPDNEHLAIGLADAIVAELAQLRPLVVRSTSAILPYLERRVSPAEAGRELAVDVILDGTFQRSGTRLRVTVQLVSAADGRSLWGTKIDTSLDDIFRMQDEVSRNIARTLEARLAGPAARASERAGQAAPPAGAVYELYLKGRVHLYRETLEESLAAVDCFDRACAADPGCALAWAGLADAYSRIAFTYHPEGEWYARAWAACDKALALDPELPEARYVRGGRLLWSPQGGFDHAGALRDLVPAVAARPHLEEAHVRLGGILHHVGLIEEVERELEQALLLAPEHVLARQHQGLCHYTRGQYAQALAIYQAAARKAPSSWVHYQVALCQLRLGRLDQAAASVDLMVAQVPGEVLAHPVLGLIAAQRRDQGEARRQVFLTVQNKRSFGHFHHAEYDLACIHALLASPDEALAWLTAAARNGFPCVPQFESDLFLASLADDPRFLRLLDDLRRERDGYARLWQELRA